MEACSVGSSAAGSTRKMGRGRRKAAEIIGEGKEAGTRVGPWGPL